MGDDQKSGMCIPYSVGEIPGKGRGLVAEAPIPGGTTVWRHVAGQYSVYDEQSLETLLSGMPDNEAVYVLEHVHCMPEFPGYMIRVLDDGELINHSNQPTLTTHTNPGFGGVRAATSVEEVSGALLGDHFTLVAARDIEQGEELTLDYGNDPDGPDYYDRLCEHYGVDWDWL